jgi:hypothetical protein
MRSSLFTVGDCCARLHSDRIQIFPSEMDAREAGNWHVFCLGQALWGRVINAPHSTQINNTITIQTYADVF